MKKYQLVVVALSQIAVKYSNLNWFTCGGRTANFSGTSFGALFFILILMSSIFQTIISVNM